MIRRATHADASDLANEMLRMRIGGDDEAGDEGADENLFDAVSQALESRRKAHAGAAAPAAWRPGQPALVSGNRYNISAVDDCGASALPSFQPARAASPPRPSLSAELKREYTSCVRAARSAHKEHKQYEVRRSSAGAPSCVRSP